MTQKIFECMLGKKKSVSGHTVPPKLILLSEIPDGEKRSEMVVNLILRYEKNGMGYELNTLFHFLFMIQCIKCDD
jgi:hypothetical protein